MSIFSSEGFDLSAAEVKDGEEIVYEVGGGATVTRAEVTQSTEQEDQELLGIGRAEEWKRQGNEEFKKGSYLEAYDLYSEAIEACPGDMKGDKILQMKDEFDEVQRAKAMSRHRMAQGRSREHKDKESEQEEGAAEKPEEFKLPPQNFGDKLAIYYCNRAAALLHMSRFEEAVKDCDVAVLLNPLYTKAYVRRSVAFESLDRTEEALQDVKKASELEPSDATIRKSVSRLQKIEDERLEKLKEETLGKTFCDQVNSRFCIFLNR